MPKNVFGKPADCTEVLLHACCAPCSSAIVEWLMANGVRPTIFYFNPNIWPREEYNIRKEESKRHAASLGIRWIDGDYDHQEWLHDVCGLEGEPERGRRCEQCFVTRLTATAMKARELGIRYFATTLASSRWKSLEQINAAGHIAETVANSSPRISASPTATDIECTFWPQNWRKGGLQERRNQLLKAYGFYNQQYCGCEFSARNAAPTKAVLRQQMREAKHQHQSQLPSLSADVVVRLQQRLDQHSPHTVMAYWPLPDEVDIRPLLERLVQSGTTVLLPKVVDAEHMTLHRYVSQDDMVEGALHIMEPTGAPFTDYDAIDVVLVPGMAFDAAGHRLGRGRGYYDRFLQAHPHYYKIGVCFSFQRVAEVPTEAHDIVMDAVV